MQLQIITATTTQKAREIREIAGYFPHCALDAFPSAPAHRARATTTQRKCRRLSPKITRRKHN